MSDTGLAGHLLQVDRAGLDVPGHPALGGLLETFVATELTKLLGFAQTRANLWHFRMSSGTEVDFLIEGPGGVIVGIEVEATVSPKVDAARHLRWLGDKLGDRFAGGIVLHLGTAAGSLGNGIYALPLSALWGHANNR